MASLLQQPLSTQVEIVDERGRPTPQFARLLQKLSVGSGLTTSNGLITLATMAAKTILANKTGATASPTACTISDILDFITGTPARGDVLYRGATDWQRLAAGTSGQFLQTQGPGADPAWATASGGGGGGTPTIRSQAFYSYNAASFNVTFPAGSAVGDVMVVFWENGFNGITGGPAGWTNISVLNNGFTNGATIAKVMTSGDISTGFVTVTAGGAFNGVAAAVCLTGSSVVSFDTKSDFGSAGSTSQASARLTGFAGTAATDLIFGMAATRGTMTPTISAGLTNLVAPINASNASGVLVKLTGGLGKLGMDETVTFPVANSGVYWCLVAFK